MELSIVLPAAAGLAGALIGGLVSWLAARNVQASQWRRDHELRHRDRRVAAYAEFLGSVQRINATGNPGAPVDDTQYQQLFVAWSTLKILGSARVQEAATDLVQALTNSRISRGATEISPYSFGEALDRFLSCARTDVDIPE